MPHNNESKGVVVCTVLLLGKCIRKIPCRKLVQTKCTKYLTSINCSLINQCVLVILNKRNNSCFVVFFVGLLFCCFCLFVVVCFFVCGFWGLCVCFYCGLFICWGVWVVFFWGADIFMGSLMFVCFCLFLFCLFLGMFVCV